MKLDIHHQHYISVMDNGPARKIKHAENLQERGEEISEPFDISSIRKEDVDFHQGQAYGDDLLQCNNLPSSRTPRGHQGRYYRNCFQWFNSFRNIWIIINNSDLIWSMRVYFSFRIDHNTFQGIHRFLALECYNYVNRVETLSMNVTNFIFIWFQCL